MSALAQDTLKEAIKLFIASGSMSDLRNVFLAAIAYMMKLVEQFKLMVEGKFEEGVTQLKNMVSQFWNFLEGTLKWS